jgi:hypothetical protein
MCNRSTVRKVGLSKRRSYTILIAETKETETYTHLYSCRTEQIGVVTDLTLSVMYTNRIRFESGSDHGLSSFKSFIVILRLVS